MKGKRLHVVLMPLYIAFALVAGILIGKYYRSLQTRDTFYIYPHADKLTNVINYISKEYVDPVDKDQLIETAIPIVVSELDPHSQYIPADEVKEVNEPLEGNFSGIGVQFNMLNDTLVILKTIANGPSEKVGILAGDRILVVDGDTVAGKKIPSDSIVSKLKGPKGTTVRVGIQRRKVKHLLYFDIVRDNIPLYSMDVDYMIRPGIGYIKLNKFSRTTFEEFSGGVIKLLQNGMRSLILDLRGNGGGYLDAAVQVADQFLDEGKLIVYTQGNAHPRQDYRASKGGLCQGIEVAILIDEGTASASEILAGAIQDNDRGIIVGRRSFGKGLVQEQTMFPDGSALRLTIARYYTPTGRCIQKPYQKGDEIDYYKDLTNRYKHGELLDKDSIKFNDSLKYTTPGGKVVYGGGGIMPDVFVPIDTEGVTDYLMDIRNQGLIYRYALTYSDRNRKELSKITNTDDFLNYLDSKDVMKDFTDFVARNGVPFNKEEYEISHDILRVQLYAYIVRNILDETAFYKVIEPIDNTLMTAIDKVKK